jgi:hypothetical protein
LGENALMEPADQDGDVTRLLDVLSDAATRREDALFEQSYRELRFFTGLTIDQTAEAIGVSSALVRKDWRFARGWLTATLREGES